MIKFNLETTAGVLGIQNNHKKICCIGAQWAFFTEKIILKAFNATKPCLQTPKSFSKLFGTDYGKVLRRLASYFFCNKYISGYPPHQIFTLTNIFSEYPLWPTGSDFSPPPIAIQLRKSGSDSSPFRLSSHPGSQDKIIYVFRLYLHLFIVWERSRVWRKGERWCYWALRNIFLATGNLEEPDFER